MNSADIAAKYQKTYFMPPEVTYDWVKKDSITKPPIWCSVDLRDGNQALIDPMSLEDKLEFFKLLVKIGFREIEVGFPASSDTEYNFIRALIERDMIPNDVTIQVLTQAREHIIRKTFEAVKGAPHAVIHLYNSTSVEQREQVFKKDKEAIKKLAVDGAQMLKNLADETEGNFTFEYSPESFSQTEVDYALEVCNAVLDVWKPTADRKAIINLPTTVQVAMPHVFACQVEYMHKHLKYRDNVVLSVHPHNDRGCGISDAEFGVLAGADRVEGTLFGNGERTGNVDIITLAMNMYSHGVDPKLDFSDMPYLVDEYEKCTRMHVYERAPYAGALVFAAFSGSHQDAIAKGMKYRAKNKLHQWNVPYIPIDPKDIGRTYDADVIRVNSQSGKGGIGYLLEQTYGYNLPPKMREHFSYLCKDISDHEHKELKPDEVLNIFEENYLNLTNGITVTDFEFMRDKDNVKIGITFAKDGEETEMEAEGNGSLNAINNALRAYTGAEYTLQVFTQHSMQGQGSQSVAASYIGLEKEDGSMFWGAGTDTDVVKANTKALLSAYNNMIKGGN